MRASYRSPARRLPRALWQVLLCNPVCVIAYTAATWFFFYDRIPTEEELLVDFFGDAYRQYRAKTYIGIPAIAWATRGQSEGVD